MAEESEVTEEEPRKRSKLPILLGLLLALLGGGAGFMAVSSGMIGGAEAPGKQAHVEPEVVSEQPSDVAYVQLDEMVISLGPDSPSRHLRFRAQLEVSPEHEQEVTSLLPRIHDVLNTYLRALKPSDLEDHGKFVLIRAQMLRRVQIVTGPDHVLDLLVMEVVLS